MSGAALPRILVAADQTTHLLISQALKDEFEVVPAGAGLDAVEKAVDGDIQCILLDLHLRGLDDSTSAVGSRPSRNPGRFRSCF